MPHVDVLVSSDLLDDGWAEALPLLQATEVARRTNGGGTVIVTIDMPFVPAGAVSVEPVFQSANGEARVASLSWRYSGSLVIEYDEDEDPPAQCWHTECGPCDWNICRQPERLARGDRGVDPLDLAAPLRSGR